MLFACTGNICRSPMAEALLRARLVDRAPEITVGSVGRLFEGHPAERGAVKAVERLGADLESFRSRIQSVDRLTGAALVLGMEQAHVRDLALLDPPTLAHAFTLPQFATLAAAHPRAADEPLRAWAERLAGQRDATGYLDHRPDLEIDDPMGQSNRVFRACAAEIDRHLLTIVDAAWPAPAPDGHDPTDPPPHGGPHADRHRR